MYFTSSVHFLFYSQSKTPDTLIRDGDSSDPGWKKVGSGIRDKHPGSATLVSRVNSVVSGYVLLHLRSISYFTVVSKTPDTL
jgi:hypothetical protein